MIRVGFVERISQDGPIVCRVGRLMKMSKQRVSRILPRRTLRLFIVSAEESAAKRFRICKSAGSIGSDLLRHAPKPNIC